MDPSALYGSVSQSNRVSGRQLQRWQPFASISHAEYVPGKHTATICVQDADDCGRTEPLMRVEFAEPCEPPPAEVAEQAPSPHTWWSLAAQSRQTPPPLPHNLSAVPSAQRSARSQQPPHVRGLHEGVLWPLLASSAT
jgi:hypothetical protein